MKTSDLKQAWSKFTVSVRGLEKQSHDLLVHTIDHMFSNRMDTSVLTFALNSLENVEGSFRIQALIAYAIEFAGVTIEPNKEQGFGFIVKKDKERSMVRGKRQLALIQNTPWYDWAEPEAMLKQPKIPDSAITQAAKGFASGDISEAEIRAFADGFVRAVKMKSQDEKVQSFAVKYLEQSLAS